MIRLRRIGSTRVGRRVLAPIWFAGPSARGIHTFGCIERTPRVTEFRKRVSRQVGAAHINKNGIQWARIDTYGS